MPSKFKKAIAAVKDQTSISLAKVGGADSSSLEVAILKATTHDEVPVDERHVTEVLQHVSSNRSYAGSCARAIGRRIGRTKNWVVAVKSLMLILRIFQDGDPHFPKEVLHAMKRGYKILNLSSFRDESTTSCPWDFTAFVRTFALYLDERLDCFLTGKLNRRTSHHPSGKTRGYSRKNVPIVRDMKPGVLLDRISHWQRLLDRAIATRPTGAAKGNRLVQTCLYAIVQETFELYRDISDGLALLLDSFFHLQYNNCVSAYHTCVRASKQFEELNFFYDLCKKIGVGRTSEFPSVQKISDELVETLQEFLKDQSSFPGTNGRTPGISTSLPPLSPKESESGSVRRSDLVERDRSMSEFGGSQCTSLEDLIGADPGFSPDRYSDPGREYPPENGESFFNANDTASVRSDPTDHRGISSVLDLLSLDGPSPPQELQVTGTDNGFESDTRAVSATSPRQEGWELVLFDSTDQQHSPEPSNNNNASFEVDLFSSINANAVSPSPSTSTLPVENNYSNPFLEDTIADLNGISGAQPHEGDFFGPSAHASFGASFTEGGFPGDLGLGIIGGDSTVPTFQADFGDSSMNGMDNFSGGFPTDMGISRANSAPPMFKADFGDDFGTVNANNANFPADFPAVLPTDFDSGNINFAAPTTFQAEVSSSHSNGHIISQQSLPIDLFGDFSNASAPKPHHARFGSDSFGPAFAFSDNFPDHNAAVLSVSPSGYSNGIVSDGIENSLSAIVPFNQPSNDDFFSTGPKFQAAPTFRANSIDMDQEELPHSSFLGFENDPFGTLTVANPAVEQQQQLWLQNQNKIMARHNDIAHC